MGCGASTASPGAPIEGRPVGMASPNVKFSNSMSAQEVKGEAEKAKEKRRRTSEDMMAVPPALGVQVEPSELGVVVAKWGRSVFEQFDTDCNGVLDKKELSRALKSLPPTPPLSLPPGSEQMSVDGLMKTMDSDGDGVISEAEWLTLLSKCPYLACALAETVNEQGLVPSFRSFRAQRAKREGEVAELEAKENRTEEDEALLVDYKAQIESLTTKIDEAEHNATRRISRLSQNGF